jgi:hypothetical protein
MRITRLQGLDDRDGRVLFVMHAENDLDLSRVILGEEAFQIVRKPRLAQMQRLQDRDGRIGRGGRGFGAHKPAGEKGGRQRICRSTERQAIQQPARGC